MLNLVLTMPIKYRTRQSAEDLLRVFFHKNLGDTISSERIYEIWGRAGRDEKKNKSWLSNLLLHLKHYNLIDSIYETRNNRNTLVGIKLTKEGIAALGRKVSSSKELETSQTKIAENDTNREKISYDNMMKLVSRFQRENPEYKVDFSITLKEESEG